MYKLVERHNAIACIRTLNKRREQLKNVFEPVYICINTILCSFLQTSFWVFHISQGEIGALKECSCFDLIQEKQVGL